MGVGKWFRHGRRQARGGTGQRSKAKLGRPTSGHVGRCLLSFEALEDRRMLANYLVNNPGDLDDDGNAILGTLRWALNQTNAEDNRDIIVFSETLPETIVITGELPITQPVAILGPGPLRLTVQQTRGNSRVFSVNIGADEEIFRAEISGLTISGGNLVNVDDGRGGAVYNRESLTLFETRIVDNRAAGGGGIFTEIGSTSIQRSLIMGNSAGGIGGGGVLNGMSDDQEMSPGTSITDSTITGNSGPGAPTDGEGYGGGVMVRNGTVSIARSTITENGAGMGAGVATKGKPVVDGEEEPPPPFAFVEVYSSIIYGNDGPDIDYVGVTEGEMGPLLWGSTVTSGGFNIVGTGTATVVGLGPDMDPPAFTTANNDLINVDPLLEELAYYGGSTEVYMLAEASPAIDSSDPAVLESFPYAGEYDARGRHFVRAFDFTGAGTGIMDRGATERQLATFEVDTLIDTIDTLPNPIDLNDDGTNSDLVFSFIHRLRVINGVLTVEVSANNGFPTGFDPGAYGMPGRFSLREAIYFARANPGLDTINFSNTLISKAILDDEDFNGRAPTINLTNGALLINEDLIVNGPDGFILEVDASGNDPTPNANNGDGSRVFLITDGNPANVFDVMINDLTIMGGDFSNSSSVGLGLGGAVFSRENLTIHNVTFKDNFATVSGGAVHAAEGTLTVEATTFSNNRSASGGAVFVNSALTANPPTSATIFNSTFSGNTATQRGGAIANSNSDVLIEFDTIYLNTSATGLGHGVINIGGNAATAVRSSIIAGNGTLTSDVAVFSATPGSYTSQGFNYIGTGANSSFTNNDVVNQTNPQLEPLLNTGGLTETHRPKPGSPVIDAGDAAIVPGTNAPPFDQRGPDFVRVFDGNGDAVARIDIGAYELQGITLTVSNPADENDGIYSVGNLSLREAIELTNLNPLPDTIIFDPAVVADNPVFFLGGVFKPGTSADMKITDDLTITGPGLAVLALDAAALDNPLLSVLGSTVFTVDDGNLNNLLTVTIEGLEVRNALSPTAGGVIFNRENLTLGNALDPALGMRLINNSTSGAGIHGGAVYTERQAGGLRPTLNVFNSEFSINATNGVDADGGAIYSLNGNVNVADTSVNGNLATLGGSDGGGIAIRSTTPDRATLISTRNFITGNFAGPNGAGDGGGVFSDNSVVVLNESFVSGNVTSGANSDGGGIAGVNGSDVTLNDSSVSYNQTLGTSSTGGGIFSSSSTLTLNRSQVWENSTGGQQASGGGIAIVDGTATIDFSSVFDNRTAGAGAHGAGVHNFRGNLNIRSSTVSGNTAAHALSNGGGVFSDTNLATRTLILNSTISGNSAPHRGGGVFNADGLTEIQRSTVTNNFTEFANSGSGVASQGTAATRTAVYSSIVAGNKASAAGATGTDVDFVDGSFVNSIQSQGFNVIGTGNGVASFNTSGGNPLIGVPDKVNVVNPLLGPLTNNGGLTLTHTLQDGSPAINSGDPNFATNPADPFTFYDQRGVGAGFERVQRGRMDVGAFESNLAPPAAADFNNNQQVNGTDFLIWQRGVGKPNATRADGDANADGVVNGQDLAIIKSEFGIGGSATAAAATASASARGAIPTAAFALADGPSAGASAGATAAASATSARDAGPNVGSSLARLGAPGRHEARPTHAGGEKALSRAARAAWDETFARLAFRPVAASSLGESALRQLATSRTLSGEEMGQDILSLDEEVFAMWGDDLNRLDLRRPG